MDFIKKHRYALIAPPIALILFLLLSSTGVFQKLEYLSVDWRYAFRSDTDPEQHDDLVIIGVDEPGLKLKKKDGFGRWPWPRSTHGVLLELLSFKNPKLVSFDFLFTESGVHLNDAQFGLAMDSVNAAITGAYSERDKSIVETFDKLKNANNYQSLVEHFSGFINVLEGWFINDQLIGKPIDESRSSAISFYANIVAGFEEAKEQKTEESSKEYLMGIIGYFGELSNNPEVKAICSKIQEKDSIADVKQGIIDFLFAYSTPEKFMGITKAITNIHGDRKGIDGQNFALFPIRELTQKGYFGFVNAEPNPIDGIRRKLPMIVRSGNHYFPSLVAQMVMQFYNVNPKDVDVYLGKEMIFKGKEKVIKIPIDEGAFYHINYRNLDKFMTYPYSQIQKALGNEKVRGVELPDHYPTLENKALLVGQVAAGLSDLGPLPNVAKAGLVYVHANAFNNILNDDYLRFFPNEPIIIGWIILAWGTLIVLNGKSIATSVATPAIIIIAYITITFWLFKSNSLQLPLFWPILSFFAIHFGSNIISWWADYKMRDNIKGMFGTYVSADLVDQMVESGEEPSLGGEEMEITAFFSDVQSFSTFSELLTPPQLVDLMNEYLTAMTDILQEEKGTLDKYIGDAIVAMYGAPIKIEGHAYHSVKTCVRVYHRQAELREKWAAEGDKWPSVVPKMQTRMGCNTGIATVGNMGAENRFNYTMMGDMVNLAARCESGAKAYGAYIMVTEESMKASSEYKDDIQFRYLDKIVVKGRSIPVAMYEVLGFKDEIPTEVKDCLEIYNNAIEQYLAQDFKKAHELFVKAQD